MTGDPGQRDGSVPADAPRDPLIRIHPRRVDAPNIRQRRPGGHARDIAVEKAGQ